MIMRIVIAMYVAIIEFSIFNYRTKQKDSIRKYHMELTRAGPICIRYLESAFTKAESWDKTEV